MNYNISIIIWDIYSIVQLFLSFHFPCNQTRGKKKLSFSLLSLFFSCQTRHNTSHQCYRFRPWQKPVVVSQPAATTKQWWSGFFMAPMAATLCMVVGGGRTWWRKSIVDKEIISSKWKRLCSNGWEKRWKLQKLNCIFQCCFLNVQCISLKNWASLIIYYKLILYTTKPTCKVRFVFIYIL